MNTDFRIALISDDPYHLGLLKGYCHAQHYRLFDITPDKVSVNAMIQMQPDIVILSGGLTQGLTQNADFELLREISLSHQIPVWYLRGLNNPSSFEKKITGWFDAILDAPLDVNQLDDYLHSRFKYHHHIIQDKRRRARRAANDRRMLMIDQQYAAIDTNTVANYTTPQDGDADCFTVEPFQIDRRSKCVLLNGKSLNLTRKEFELFELLAQHVDRVFMTDEIIDHVWPENSRVTKSDLYQYMHLLRKKIEDDPNNPHWILTVKGFGYKLNAAPLKVNSPSLQ